ncbi:MAG TPA: hypothetical protein VFG05_05060 [Methylocella sp.]|nr:hypothetical protein [Methylocella sp.]
MTTDCGQGRIAEQYKQGKEQPWRSRIETYEAAFQDAGFKDFILHDLELSPARKAMMTVSTGTIFSISLLPSSSTA